MKNLFRLILLSGAFMIMASITTNAQSINNQTDCWFQVKVGYGVLPCNVTTSDDYVLIYAAPNTVTPFTLPPGRVMLAATGNYVMTSPACHFSVSIACDIPDMDIVSCSESCGSYTAQINPVEIKLTD